ncbi:unnamed protein product [Effrenium voratum]|nr:unnamed protein product [Effrenium voratum]
MSHPRLDAVPAAGALRLGPFPSAPDFAHLDSSVPPRGFAQPGPAPSVLRAAHAGVSSSPRSAWRAGAPLSALGMACLGSCTSACDCAQLGLLPSLRSYVRLEALLMVLDWVGAGSALPPRSPCWAEALVPVMARVTVGLPLLVLDSLHLGSPLLLQSSS